MIREFRITDTEQIMTLWLAGNREAHSFVPESYWDAHFDEVREALRKATVFVYDTDGKIQGFLGLTGEYIAGLFVEKEFRSRGIGAQLLNHAKQRSVRLSLEVYKKNTRAVSFYLRENFSVLSETTEEDTGEPEYLMLWQ